MEQFPGKTKTLVKPMEWKCYTQFPGNFPRKQKLGKTNGT